MIIQIPIDLEVSAHTGGSLAWDKDKNLFISTGDNTVPFESDGFAPMDERAGRHTFDAQRSAGNPNDLRGKILRIHPHADGSYSIPDGNLFAKGTAGTRPEIYVMGCRNPYRISVDQATSFVYWGEVGPDAGQDSRHGPRGYDEFNQARKAGNFGWPYFVGNSIAYHDSDFATKEIGPLFDINGPTNNSPNNTGIKVLPPTTAPLIYYPYNLSAEFPALGLGGRCAMGGPVYNFNAGQTSPTKLPAYYDKAYFIYDWMRNWVFAVRLDDNYNFQRLEPFMQTNGDFRRPVDMEIGPDGSIYMLEYGSVYGIDNVDARLVRIDYNGGNRAPVAKISVKDSIGIAPLKVQFTNSSYDFDESDALTYQWSLNGNVISTAASPSYTFNNNGIYKPVLKVTDPSGQSSTDTVEIKVGNTKPVVVINTTDNSTFFFPKTTALHYDVQVTDKEESSIDKKKVKVTVKYIPKVASSQSLEGHQQINENYNYGMNLIANSDCKACHQMNAKSVGPSFMDVSKKYISDKNAVGYLANKVITGGAGVWGEHAMSAHPQFSKEDATEIVKYVLTVSNQQKEQLLPQSGSILLNQQVGNEEEGRYIVNASYTDNGGAITPLTGASMLMLRPAKMQAEDADNLYNLNRGRGNVGSISHRAYFVFKQIDLKDIDSLAFRYSSVDKSGTIQVHADGLKGALLATLQFSPTGAWNKYVESSVTVTDPGGKHDLYFVFLSGSDAKKNLCTVDWVNFIGGKEVTTPVNPKKSAKTAKPAVAKTEATPVAERQKPKPGNSSALAGAGIALMEKSDCKACHANNAKLVGPSFVAIAQRYKNNRGAVAMLAKKVLNGGAGNWGQIPMTPHPALSKAEATQIVQYILTVKK